MLLDQTISIENITLFEVLSSGERIDFLQLHQLLIKGNYIDHVYHDYISPVNEFMRNGNNLIEYYKFIGSSIIEFVKTYSDKLDECYSTVGWPFSSMSTFGKVLKKIIQLIPDDSVRLICLKQIWLLAFEADQWSVQTDLKEVYTTQFISAEIEGQLAEYIISRETKVDLSKLSRVSTPKSIKLAVISGNKMADVRMNQRAEEQDEF